MNCAILPGAIAVAALIMVTGPARADEEVVERNGFSAAPPKAARTSQEDEAPPRPPRAAVRRDAIGVELSFWASERYGMNWPFVLFVQHRVVDVPGGSLHGALRVPFAVGAGREREQDHGAMGNPTAGLHYATTTRGVTSFAGAWISIPIASAGGPGADLIVERAAAATGYRDLHLWSVGYLPIGVPFGLEAQAARGLWLRGKFMPTVYAAIEAWAETRVSLQTQLEIEGRASGGAGGGLALHAVGSGVFRSPRNEPDQTQSSIEPYFVYDGPVIVRAGMVFALDPPLGGGDRSALGVIALRTMVGARLD